MYIYIYMYMYIYVYIYVCVCVCVCVYVSGYPNTYVSMIITKAPGFPALKMRRCYSG